MATLEKIRSKSVFLLVVIGLALLAFVIGDFFTSGRTFFGTGTTIAKVGGQKIDVQEFQHRVEQANLQYQNSGQKIDQAVLQQQVLSQMIAEKLFNKEIDELGLVVTDSELTDAMLGANSQYVNQLVQQQTGIESAAMVNDMINNPAKYQLGQEQVQQIRDYWIGLEKQIEQELLQAKFQNLFAGTIVANQLDAKALYDENAATSHIAYAKKEYSSLPDDKFAVSDDEIKAEWNKTKKRYELSEPMRAVSYIAVGIVPSAGDLAAGKKAVENALSGLRYSNELEGLKDMPEFIVDRQTVTKSAIRDEQLKKFVDSASVATAERISVRGNEYTLAKLLGKTQAVDSVNVDMMMVNGTRAQVDSIVNALNGGTAWAEVAKSSLVSGSQDSTWVSLVDPNLAMLKSTLENTTVGQAFTPDTIADGGRVFRVRNRRAAVPVYDLAVVRYTIEPSDATVEQLTTSLQDFVDNNKTAADFEKNAPAAHYTTTPAKVSPSTPQLGRLEDSRDMVAWAMNAKKGEVSPVFGDESAGRVVALTVDDIYDSGYVPSTDPDVRSQLLAKIRDDKKAADLLGQYKGKAKDLAGYAKLMGSSVDSAAVTFGQFFISGLGANESEITARVANAKKGQLVGPVKGNTGVVVFQVADIDNSGRPYNFDESAMMYMQQRGAGVLMRQLTPILIGNEKITNNMLKFFNRN